MRAQTFCRFQIPPQITHLHCVCTFLVHSILFSTLTVVEGKHLSESPHLPKIFHSFITLPQHIQNCKSRKLYTYPQVREKGKLVSMIWISRMRMTTSLKTTMKKLTNTSASLMKRTRFNSMMGGKKAILLCIILP